MCRVQYVVCNEVPEAALDIYFWLVPSPKELIDGEVETLDGRVILERLVVDTIAYVELGHGLVMVGMGVLFLFVVAVVLVVMVFVVVVTIL